jgi:hypothetical protein
MVRSIIASLIALALLAGCSTLQGTALQAVKLAWKGKPAVELTPAQVAANPYAQLRVDSPDGDAVLVLGNVDGGRQAWYSAGHEIVFLRDGVLVKTSGLQWNIEHTRLPADSPFRTGLQHVQAPVASTRMLDLPDYRYGVVASSQLVPGGMEAVTILDTTRQLRRIDEHLEAPGLDFAADNVYWIDPADGFIWKSRQAIPGGPTLTLTVLRPYRP